MVAWDLYYPAIFITLLCMTGTLLVMAAIIIRQAIVLRNYRQRSLGNDLAVEDRLATLSPEPPSLQETLERRHDSGLIHAIVDASTDAIFAKDLEGKYLLLNNAVAQVTGRSKEQIVGHDDSLLFEPEQARWLMQRDREIMRSGKATTAEELLTSGGVTRTFSAMKSPFYDARGHLAGIIGISRDISDRKNDERVIKERQEIYRTVIETSSDGFWVVDLEGNLIEVNDAYSRCSGYSQAELLTMRVWDLDGLEDEAASRDRIANIVRTGSARFETYHRRKDDTLWPVEINASYSPLEGGRLFVFGRDETQRKLADKELRQHQQLLARACEVAGLGIWYWIPDTNTVWWSDEMYERFGLTRNTFQPSYENYLQLVHPDDRSHIRECIEAVVGAPGNMSYDARIVCRDHSIVWIHVVAHAVRDDSGRLIRLDGIDQNITARKRTEEALHQAQKMEAVGRLAGGIAHDFNNLLTVIKGYCELLLDVASNDPVYRDSLIEIRDAGSRAARLTQQLLAFGQRAIVHPRLMDLGRVIDDCTPAVRELIGQRIELKLDVESKATLVRADVAQIEQLIMNLVVNARDAMPEGGQLSIGTRRLHFDVESHHVGRAVRAGNYVELCVSDTGCGITEEHQLHVFDPFFSTKPVGHGRGLGLSVVHGVAHESGGYVCLESTPNLGTSFHVLLPDCTQTCDSSELPLPMKELVATSTMHEHTATILVVEDDQAVRGIVSNLLRSEGYHVILAATAMEALELPAQVVNSVNLLLTDVVMPGMGGRELAQRLLAQSPELKVLFMSGYTDDTVVRHGIATQDSFLPKPFTIEALKRKIKRMLETLPPPIIRASNT